MEPRRVPGGGFHGTEHRRNTDCRPAAGEPLLLGVIFLCTLVTLADGYNISVIAFAAPGIVKAWHLNRAALGPLFSSSLVAGLIGPFLFGTLGDRIGRRSSMIAAVLMIGIFGVVSGYCTSLVALVITRFVAGIGMSGALAVTVAAVNEFAPRRLRATFVTIVFSGTTIGSGLPGLVAPAILAEHGWQSLFFIGGVVPVVLALAVYLFLPETPKFLCLRSARHAELGRLLRRIEPQLQAPAEAQYVLSGEATGASSVGLLFTGKLALLTPLLWFGAFVAQLVFHSFNTWLPTLMTDSGVSHSPARRTWSCCFNSWARSGGWVIARPLDRLGMVPCTILYVLSIPVIASSRPAGSQRPHGDGAGGDGGILHPRPAFRAGVLCQQCVSHFGACFRSGLVHAVRPCRRRHRARSWSGSSSASTCP